MKHGYGERWEGLSLTVDKLGEDAEGNHLLEVSVHDRMDEINLRIFVSKEYYGSMIPWLASRVVISDLATWPLDRARRLNLRRMENEVWYEDKAASLRELDSATSLYNKAQNLPDHAVRGNLVYLTEARIPEGGDTSSEASLHNAHKLIFDRGLPDVLEFMVDQEGARIVEARWGGRPGLAYVHRFLGFDWQTTIGKYALGEFLEMLNLHQPIGMEDIRPRRMLRRKGPKEWSPYEVHNFMLHKGKDYGRSNQV